MPHSFGRVAAEAKRLWDSKYGRKVTSQQAHSTKTAASGNDDGIMGEIEMEMQGRLPGVSLFESYAVTADARSRLTLTLDEFKRYNSQGGPGVVAPQPDEAVDAEIPPAVVVVGDTVRLCGGGEGQRRGAISASHTCGVVSREEEEGRKSDTVGEWDVRAIERSHEICVDR
jgi:hypothetical protein